MNQGLFRLVFSRHLGMYVPASEAARGHMHKTSGSRARSRQRALLTLLTVASFVSASFVSASVYAETPAGLVPTNGGAGWQNAIINSSLSSANIMTITQTAQKAILDWDKFNINAGQVLNMQDQAAWSALHRIHDTSPSQILGTINASGHQYLINTNGIIFGAGAQVNVGSLTASSLDITNDLFKAGLMTQAGGTPNFIGTGGFVWVREGASITAATGGRVMLLAPEVTNSGVITTPEGQTILAAGKKVYLLDSTDPAGLLVEVDSGGTATNLGTIVSKLGNVTLMGLAVNQQGTISASTSVRRNGSIQLLARDTVDTYFPATGSIEDRYTVKGYGTVNIGKNSVTEVTAEVADKEEIINAQAFTPSSVDVVGRTINVDGLISAKGGTVNLNAREGIADDLKSPLRVWLGDNANIDVSGYDAIAPASRNQLVVQLFSEQLKDSPLLRGGNLFSKTVYIDARKGTPLIGASVLQTLMDGVGYTVAEKMSKGGTVNITAGDTALPNGSVVSNSGAVIKTSGGSVTYEAGLVKESSLIYQGKNIPISEAKPDINYFAVADNYTATDTKYNVTRSVSLTSSSAAALSSNSIYNQSYLEGQRAGVVNLSAQNAVLNGSLVAETKSGVFQRGDAATNDKTKLVDGGTFNLTLTGSSVDIVNKAQVQATSIAANDALTDAQRAETKLDTSLIKNGFNHLSIKATNVIVDDAISLKPQGSFKIDGTLRVNQDITAISGTVSATGKATIANGVHIDTSGLWTNDTSGLATAFTAPVSTTAGAIDFSGGLQMDANSLLSANAGAWLNSKGKLTTGTAGNVTVGRVEGGVNAEAYGFNKGGALNFSTQQSIQVGGKAPADSSTFWISDSFLSQGGFSSYAITSDGTNPSIVIGDVSGASSVIHPIMQTLQVNSGTVAKASGTNITDVASVVQPSAYLRKPVSLSFAAKDTSSFGDVTLLANTKIELDSPYATADKGSVKLSAGNHVTVLGSIIAPASDISLSVNASNSKNYDNTQGVFVGENAILSTAGFYAILPPNASGLSSNKVLAAGNIGINSSFGSVVLKQGSVLDASGTSGRVDVNLGKGYVSQSQSGNAGNISIAARDGMVLDGTFKAIATGTAAGGSLSLSLTGAETSSNDNQYPSESRTLTVTQNKQIRGAGIQEGDSLDSTLGKAQISADQINSAGFDRLNLTSKFGRDVSQNYSGQDSIVLDGGVNLKAATSIQLDAQKIGVNGNGVAAVNSAYVYLQSETPNDKASNSVALTQSPASLVVNADWIDLNGKIAIDGVNSTSLNSRLDIRARGQDAIITSAIDARYGGWLATSGALNLTARQIYPVSNSLFTFDVTGANSQINIASSGVASTGVLSAGGKLVMNADQINQAGVVKAPLGQLELNASKQLVLADNSITSISADGLSIPYGTTENNGTDWKVSTGTNLPSYIITNPLEKKITLNSADIQAKTGSKLDISGGGDAVAYEFVPGIGGSKDILAQPGVYAIMPSARGGEYAAFDYGIEKTSANVTAGTSIYISGGNGLAAGYYTLLPARYALLPGAYMVQTSSVSVLPNNQTTLADGSVLSAGYFSTANGKSSDVNWTTFTLTDGSLFNPAAGTFSKAPSEYLTTSGNEYFKSLANKSNIETPRLAEDVGQVVFNAGKNLTLDGQLVANNPSNARGGIVDISSDNISIVSQIGVDDGSLQLTSSSLSNLNAGSLLVGGTRSQEKDGVKVTTKSSQVKVANDSSHALKVNELVIASSDKLTLSNTSTIVANTNSTSVGTEKLKADGDGALLAVSGVNNFVFDRTTTTAPVIGTLDIQTGANVQAGQSLVLDSTKSSNLGGVVTVNDGGTATLGANRILLGNSDNTQGLQLDNQKIANLGKLSALTLNSQSNIDMYGALSFGDANRDITLNAGGIVGHMGSGESANIVAKNLLIENTTGASVVTNTSANNSSLNLNTQNTSFKGKDSANTNTNAGNSVISGFDAVNANATGQLILAGDGQVSIQAAAVNINSGRVTAENGAKYVLNSSGDLNTTQTLNPTTLPDATGNGAKVILAGGNVNLGGNVVIASGNLTVQATKGNVNVLSDADIDVSSQKKTFASYSEYTPAGNVTLQSDQGNVTTAAGSLINVSGGKGADSGELAVKAQNGSALLAGSLDGHAVAGLKGGSFRLDTKTLSNFAQINTALEAGNFTNSRDIRLRTGDIQVSATDTITAKNVTLTADAGNIQVDGKVDAHANSGGLITLNAAKNITLTNGSQLDVHSTDKTAKGGTVNLETKAGTLDLQTGSAVNVSGGEGGNAGVLNLIAPRTGAGAGNDVAVTAVKENLIGDGAKQNLVATQTYNNVTTLTTDTSNTATLGLTKIANDIASFISNRENILTRLGKSGDSSFRLVTGVEVKSTGNLSIGADLNFASLRDASGNPGVLTLRATNNLNVNGSLNDGYATTATKADTLGTGESWNYRLVSGADLSSANSIATIANTSSGNLTLASGKFIRTGTGNIDIATGGNLTMGSNTSAIYTVGVKAEDLSGFVSSDDTASAMYLKDGGDINLSVKGSIVGKVASTPQLVNNWLFRQGGGDDNYGGSWWVRPDLFQQGVATLGGGNIKIKAGGDITNFSASTPTTAQYAEQILLIDGVETKRLVNVLNGGGDLSVKADGSIYGGVYYVGKGQAEVSAGDSIKATGAPFGTVIALQDANVSVSAINDAFIQTVFNPTLFNQSTNNTTALTSAGTTAYFNTYGESSSVKLASVNGDVSFGTSAASNNSFVSDSGNALINNRVRSAFINASAGAVGLSIQPANFEATSYNGNVNIGGLNLMPSATGNLTLLASGNVAIDSIAMSNATPSGLYNVNNIGGIGALSTSSGLPVLLAQNSNPSIHQADNEIIKIIADEGSITSRTLSNGQYIASKLTLPKQADIEAGKDIINLKANIQQYDSGGITVIKAGRDYINNGTNLGGLTIAGPGELLVKAGRDINLGISSGIQSVGNTRNSALPAESANITLLAGLGDKAENVDGYIAKYIEPNLSDVVGIQQAANAYLAKVDTSDNAKFDPLAEAYKTRLSTISSVTTYIRKLTNNQVLSDQDAATQFLALDKNQQSLFVYRHFSSELLADGKTYSDTQNHLRGDNAIATLFGNGGYAGDLLMYKSQVKTLQGGSVDLLAPGGIINVGLPGGTGSNVGVITEKGGDIRAFAENGFEVNQSKVITQYGGDITIWVNNGDIDAGRGSKTAIAVPETFVSTDADGLTTVEFKGVATGSGIRAQSYDPDGSTGKARAPSQGNVALIAPRGKVNLGEAGIGGNNLLLVTPQPVIGLGGIDAAGKVTGGNADTSSLGGATSLGNNVADVTKSTTDQVAQQLSQSAAKDFVKKNFLPSFISVEVIGLGDI